MLVLEILLGLAAGHLIERRLRNVEMTTINDLAHLPIKKRQKQRADVGAVNVGIRHDDNLVVAQFVDGKLIGANAGAERRDERADLLGRQHLVHARALDIQNLAAQRQHRLKFAIAALFGAAAGGIALDDKQFRFRRIALLTVGELSRQRSDAKSALARHFAGLARGFARRGGLDYFADNGLGLGRMLLEPSIEHIVDDALDRRPDLRGHELVLGLGRKFWVGHFDRQYGRQSFAAVVAG